MTIVAVHTGLARVYEVIDGALRELGDDVRAYDLGSLGLPYAGDDFHAEADGVVSGIQGADGVVFVFEAFAGLPSARLAAFMEYFRAYPDALRGKQCLVATEERAAAAAFAEALCRLGAADAVRVVTNGADLDADAAAVELIGRQAEDFFRIVRQRRKVPGAPAAAAPVAYHAEKPAEPKAALPPVNVAELYDKHQPTTQEHKRDIMEIAGLYAQRFRQEGDRVVSGGLAEISRQTNAPRARTCAQLTRALTHHLNALSGGIEAVFQFHVEGDDGFDGYISVSGSACAYADGAADAPDVTMLSDDQSWKEVLKGKISAKKAFMVGRLKVRGNFMLLTKFDEMFDFSNM